MSQYRTPLRYPGGKQKIAPFIRELLAENKLLGGHYAEPYAGGAGVAIELLLNGDVSHIHLNDACYAVYAFWKSILSKPDEFCRRVSGASLTIKEWRRQQDIIKRQSEFDMLDVGFSMFYLNRCNRSGIISGGVIGGLAQTGNWKIDARFSRNDLIRRIEAIALNKSKITVTHADAEDFIIKHLPKLPQTSLVYCDPPYFHKADRLYLNHYSEKDHDRIAQVIQTKLALPWLVSYDKTPEILGFYKKQRTVTYSLQYNAAKAYLGTEVFFFSPELIVPAMSSIPSISEALKRVS